MLSFLFFRNPHYISHLDCLQQYWVDTVAKFKDEIGQRSIYFQFSSSPVSSLGVVPNLVIGLVAEPVGKRPVLSLLLGKPSLLQQGLVRSHCGIKILLFQYIPTNINQDDSYKNRIKKLMRCVMGIKIAFLWMYVTDCIIISYLIMMLAQAEVILIHANTENPQKRHKVPILPTTTFNQFQGKVKQLYKIKDNQIDLIIQQSNREIALNQYNFQAYKQTVHINKRIKVKEYDVLSLTYIAPLVKKQEKTRQEIIIVPSDLKPIPESLALYDYSSFFADDFHTIVPFLQTIRPLKPDIQYSEQEKISLRLIQHIISSSIRPAIENFCSNPDNMSKLANQ